MIGTCLCGAVEFEIDPPYPRFRWRTGEASISTWQRSTGFRSHFCSSCGAAVPNPLRDTGYIWVPSGSLDGDGPLEIAAQLYVDSRAS